MICVCPSTIETFMIFALSPWWSGLFTMAGLDSMCAFFVFLCWAAAAKGSSKSRGRRETPWLLPSSALQSPASTSYGPAPAGSSRSGSPRNTIWESGPRNTEQGRGRARNGFEGRQAQDQHNQGNKMSEYNLILLFMAFRFIKENIVVVIF